MLRLPAKSRILAQTLLFNVLGGCCLRRKSSCHSHRTNRNKFVQHSLLFERPKRPLFFITLSSPARHFSFAMKISMRSTMKCPSLPSGTLLLNAEGTSPLGAAWCKVRAVKDLRTLRPDLKNPPEKLTQKSETKTKSEKKHAANISSTTDLQDRVRCAGCTASRTDRRNPQAQTQEGRKHPP